MKNRWHVLFLIVWSIGILFPFYFMRRFLTLYRTGFDRALRTDLSHIIMHIILYAVLAWLISSVFSNRDKLVAPIKVMLIALAISMLQEAIQLISIQYSIGWDDVVDIFVDLSGVAIGVIVFRFRWRKNTLDKIN